jgi:large conductance mechanosensitive channel
MGLGKLWAEFKAFAFQGNMIDLAVAVVIGGAFGGVIHSLVGDVIMPTVAYLIHEGEQGAKTLSDAGKAVAAKAGLPTSQATTEPTTASTDTTTPPATPIVPASATPEEARKIVLAQVADHKMEVEEGNKVLSTIAAAPAPAAPAVAEAAKPDDTKPVQIDFKVGPVPVGKFVTELINFMILALAVFIMMVKLLGGVMKKVSAPEKPGEPTTRECPECLSIIPIKAKRCSHCTAVIVPPATA